MTSAVGDALLVERRRLGRKRLRRRIPLAGHVALRHGALLDRPHRLARLAVQHVDEGLLRHLREGFDTATVDRDVGEHRRRRQVVVPDAVMQRLEVPHAFAGRRVERDDRLGVQVVAGPRAAVVVAGRLLGGQVDVTELLVGAEQRPNTAVAGVRPRVLEPGLVAGLAGPRHDVKRPQLLARAHVVAAHVVGRHFFRRELRFVQDVGSRGRHARHDDDVAHDERAARPAPARDGALESLREVHLAAVAEVRVALARLRVQRDEARADVGDDACVGAIGPIGEAARRAAAREAGAVGARRQMVVPHGFARRRIERHDGPDDRAHVQQAVHHERRVLEVARPVRCSGNPPAAPRACWAAATRYAGCRSSRD